MNMNMNMMNMLTLMRGVAPRPNPFLLTEDLMVILGVKETSLIFPAGGRHSWGFQVSVFKKSLKSDLKSPPKYDITLDYFLHLTGG